jgi:type III pantothenate kinase
MQGLVTIDFGNSHPHAGIFSKDQSHWQLLKVVPWKELGLFLDQLQMNASNTSLVLCAVKAREEELLPFLEKGFLLTRVQDYWKGNKFAGMPVFYAHSLGEDRLIQNFYAYKKLKEKCLIIDAGTFTTMDVVTTNGFEGGYIFPAFNSYAALFQQGEQLKATSLDSCFSQSLPQKTQEAMRDSYIAFAALAKSIIKEHQIQKILLSGGQGASWKDLLGPLPPSLIVQSEPNLIHLALHYWMTTQIEIL